MLEQPEKAELPMDFRETGRDVRRRFEHPEKAESPIEVMDSGSRSDVLPMEVARDEHPEKAKLPIEVMELGMSMLVRLTQFAN